jgi:hypothetical protein
VKEKAMDRAKNWVVVEEHPQGDRLHEVEAVRMGSEFKAIYRNQKGEVVDYGLSPKGPRAAVSSAAGHLGWAVKEILAPGQLSRAEEVEQVRQEMRDLRLFWHDHKDGDDFALVAEQDTDRVIVEAILSNALEVFERDDEENCVSFMRAVSQGHFKRARSFYNEDGGIPSHFSVQKIPIDRDVMGEDELKERAKLWLKEWRAKKADEETKG